MKISFKNRAPDPGNTDSVSMEEVVDTRVAEAIVPPPDSVQEPVEDSADEYNPNDRFVPGMEKRKKSAAEMWEESRAARRERRLASFRGLDSAVWAASRTAQRLLWDLTADRSDGEAVSKSNVRERALRLARSMVGQYAKHGLKLEFSGIRGHGSSRSATSDIDDATIMIDAQITTATGVRVPFEMPMQVVGGRLLEPSIILVDGAPRIIAPSTFRDIIQGRTAYQTRSDRKIYDPPRDAVHQWRDERRSRGMFASKDAQDALRRAIRTGNFDMEIPARTAASGDEEMKNWKGEGNNVDEADVMVDEEVVLCDDIEIVQPGGHSWVYEAGRTARIASIDGKYYTAEMDDGTEAVLTRDMFKTAQELSDEDDDGCEECGCDPCECDDMCPGCDSDLCPHCAAGPVAAPHDADAPVGSEEDVVEKLKSLVDDMMKRGLSRVDMHKMMQSMYPELAGKFVMIIGRGDSDEHDSGDDAGPPEG